MRRGKDEQLPGGGGGGNKSEAVGSMSMRDGVQKHRAGETGVQAGGMLQQETGSVMKAANASCHYSAVLEITKAGRQAKSCN